VHQGVIYFRYYGLKQVFGIQDNLYPTDIPSQDLTRNDIVYLFGSENPEFTDQNRTQAMVEAFPDDPKIYAHFVAKHFPKLPDNYRETVNRIAPDNGWFDEVEASTLGRSFIREEKIPLSEVKKPGPETGSKKRRRRVARTRKVVDYEILGQMVELLHQAAEKPNNTDYSASLARERIALLSNKGDYQSRNLELITSIAYNGRTSTIIRKMMTSYCDHLIEKGDAAEFKRLVGTVQSLSRNHLRGAADILSFLIWRGDLNHKLEVFAKTAGELDLPKLKSKLQAQHKELSILIEKTKNQKTSDEFHNLVEQHAPFFLRFASSYGGSPAVQNIVTKESLLPGTKSESAHIAWRWLMQFFFVLTFLSLFTLAHACYFRSHFRRPIPILVYFRSIVLGSIIPMGAFLAFRHLSPLGNLDRGPG